MPNNEAYARFTDEKGKIVKGQFKTRLDVFASKIENIVTRVGITDASQIQKAMLHEFGSYHRIEFEDEGKKYNIKGVPARSFIRMPLKLFLPKALEEVKILATNDVKTIPEEVSRAIGETSVEVIHEAFNTQGFGQWLSHQNEEYAKDNDNPVLDKTGKLKNSISFEVIDKETI